MKFIILELVTITVLISCQDEPKFASVESVKDSSISPPPPPATPEPKIVPDKKGKEIEVAVSSNQNDASITTLAGHVVLKDLNDNPIDTIRQHETLDIKDDLITKTRHQNTPKYADSIFKSSGLMVFYTKGRNITNVIKRICDYYGYSVKYNFKPNYSAVGEYNLKSGDINGALKELSQDVTRHSDLFKYAINGHSKRVLIEQEDFK
jgi:hypothetical protein